MVTGFRVRVALAATAVFAASWATPVLPASPATGGDWVSVTKVTVDRLGGVNVAGQVSCEGAYQKIVAGTLQDSDGNAIVLQPGDKVNLQASNDNYVVSQPSGRKS